MKFTRILVYLRVSACGDYFEPYVAEGVEDHDGVCLDADAVTWLTGRGATGVAWPAGAVKLCL